VGGKKRSWERRMGDQETKKRRENDNRIVMAKRIKEGLKEGGGGAREKVGKTRDGGDKI